MKGENAIVELTKQDLDPKTFGPTADFVSRIEQRVSRCGSTRVPGFAIVPETSHLLGDRGRFNRFINRTLERLLTGWKASGSSAISHVDYLYASGQRVDRYYQTSELVVNPSRLIGVTQTSFFLHSDFLRIQYSAISYGKLKNVSGGTLRIFDALQAREQAGIPLMDFVSTQVPARKSDSLNDRQYYFVGRMELIRRYPEYLLQFPVKLGRMPLVIVSNRYPIDGLMHGPTRIHKKKPNLPLRRPSYLASIAAQYLTKEQMFAL